MGFLSPALLALGALAGVPLLVHLLRRKIGRTVDFPAVRYLTRMEQEHSRELKLKHRLLLFLRVLAVLALAFAAARPIARFAGLGHAPVALALVVDNSMSSGAVLDGRAVLDDLKSDARGLLATLSADDRAWLVFADGRTVGGPISTLQRALDDARALGGRGDTRGALRRAAALARSGSPRAPVVALVSDGQANALEEANGTAGSTSPAGGNDRASTLDLANVPLVALVRPRGAVRNRAVMEARAEPARWTPTGTVALALSSADSAAWRIVLDGRTVARGTAGPAAPADPVRLAQRLGSSATGWVRGSVELDADELRGDDARYFAVRVAPPPIVTVRGEAGPFLSTALATLVEEKRLARGTDGAAGTVTVAGADAAGLRGAVLLTAPSDPVRVGEANRTLARLGIPWRFGAIARDLVLTRDATGDAANAGRGSAPGTGGADSSTRANVGAASPPTNDRGTSALDGVPVRLRYPLVRSPGTAGATAGTTMSDTLAMAGGAPWAVAGPDYVLVASPIDPDATDLPVRAGFVPWLLDALSRRLGDAGRVVEAHPGQRLTGFAGLSALERPDGSLLPLSGDRLTAPSATGVYFLRREAVRVGALVVNPDPLESVLGQGSAGGDTVPMLRPATGETVRATRDPGAWQRTIFDSASGRSLLPPLVAIALVALLLEAWFSRERAARGQTVTARTGAPSPRAQKSSAKQLA